MAAVGDIWETVLYGRLHSQEIRNVFHYQCISVSGTPNPTDDTAGRSLNAGMEGFWNVVRPNVSSEYSCYGIISARIKPLPRTAGTVTVPVTGAGGVSGSALPSSVALIIRKRTLYAGRAYRGRTYWAGIPVVQENDSVVSAAAQTAWAPVATMMATILTPAAINGTTFVWVPVLYSKKTGLTNQIQSCSLDLNFRNQRRRQVGKGV